MVLHLPATSQSTFDAANEYAGRTRRSVDIEPGELAEWVLARAAAGERRLTATDASTGEVIGRIDRKRPPYCSAKYNWPGPAAGPAAETT